MLQQGNDFEELGLKVRRAEQQLEQVRGVGTVHGVRVVVDAENRLLSVTVGEEDLILAAYNAALADKQPKVDEATRELRADSRFEALSTFAANAIPADAQRTERELQDDDDDYYAERNRTGWLES